MGSYRWISIRYQYILGCGGRYFLSKLFRLGGRGNGGAKILCLFSFDLYLSPFSILSIDWDLGLLGMFLALIFPPDLSILSTLLTFYNALATFLLISACSFLSCRFHYFILLLDMSTRCYLDLFLGMLGIGISGALYLSLYFSLYLSFSFDNPLLTSGSLPSLDLLILSIE